jgi:hypothetical protein
MSWKNPYVKQLSSDHIAEQRFLPYKRARNYIKHLENVLAGNKEVNISRIFAASPEINRENHSFQNSTGKRSPTPDLRLSQQFLEKLALINSFHNISKTKPGQKNKPRVVSPDPRIVKKTKYQVNKRYYHDLMHKAMVKEGNHMEKSANESRCEERKHRVVFLNKRIRDELGKEMSKERENERSSGRKKELGVEMKEKGKSSNVLDHKESVEDEYGIILGHDAWKSEYFATVENK